MVVKVDVAKCTGCAQCTTVCPVNVMQMNSGKAVFTETAENKCISCHACEVNCPFGALQVQ